MATTDAWREQVKTELEIVKRQLLRWYEEERRERAANNGVASRGTLELIDDLENRWADLTLALADDLEF